jgi:hypothetical protein
VDHIRKMSLLYRQSTDSVQENEGNQNLFEKGEFFEYKKKLKKQATQPQIRVFESFLFDPKCTNISNPRIHANYCYNTHISISE